MKRLWAGSLSLALGLLAPFAHAEQAPWEPAADWPPVTVTQAEERPAAFPTVTQAEERPAVVPAVTLGRPLALPYPAPSDDQRFTDPQVTQASYTGQVVLEPPQPLVVRAQAVPYPDPVPGGGPPPFNPGAPPPINPGGPPPINPGIPPNPNERYNCGVVTEPPAGGHPWFGKELFNFGAIGAAGGGRAAFQSDHCFDSFISPVTNPFLFEDPRSLTEVRPIFMLQGAPGNNPIFRGSDIEFLGLQARVALTDRLSVVVNKLGYVWEEVHDPALGFESHSGFEELWLGPKYTFIRSEQTNTLLAGGLTFQLPIGSGKVQQDTGDLSLTPYLSFAQNFGKTTYGSFNFLNTTGYTFGDDQRTDYFFSSFHLDFDIAHRVYPLIEANWFHYTSSGSDRPLNFEGTDLFNFGSTMVNNQDFISMAAGVRVKINDRIQTGFAAEFPVTGQHELMDYRLTFDMIFRY